jgi:2-polyprenyl-3-methyl-5-hydroxy-6-metoxy-1,4-benzoquinol methylase
MSSVKHLDRCLCCDSELLEVVLDLGDQPLANSFLKSPAYLEQTFPLVLNICQNCSHLQLSHAVDPDLLFKNYLYVSGTSKTLLDYFKWFAEYTLRETFGGVKHAVVNPSVLDIACNDGSQLTAFRNLGFKTYGVDPATNLHSVSTAAGHDVVCDYLTRDHVQHFADKRVDIITAQNVFAHNSYPLEFLEICRDIMHDHSRLFIQTSQANMIQNGEFDTIYHEHLSFFNARSMSELARRAGLHLINVTKMPIHGTSYVFTFSKLAGDTKAVDTVLTAEREEGLQAMETYRKYARKCMNTVLALSSELSHLQNEGYLIVGYGAAAKGNTLLNALAQVGVPVQERFHCIVDDNPLKQGLFTPGTRVPVVGIDWFESEGVAERKIALVPLAWNFFDEIRKRVKAVRDNEDDIYVRYFPTVRREQ